MITYEVGSNSSPLKLLQTFDCYCTKCSKGVGEKDSIECDRCEGWVHLECTGMGDAEFTNIKQNKFDIMKYYCPRCTEEISKGLCKDQNHAKSETNYNTLLEMVKLLQEQNKMIIERLDKNEKKEPAPVV